MAKLNSVVRALVKLMYGAELPPGTHAQALVHYRRASELAPGRLVHRCGLFQPSVRRSICLQCKRMPWPRKTIGCSCDFAHAWHPPQMPLPVISSGVDLTHKGVSSAVGVLAAAAVSARAPFDPRTCVGPCAAWSWGAAWRVRATGNARWRSWSTLSRWTWRTSTPTCKRRGHTCFSCPGGMGTKGNCAYLFCSLRADPVLV